MPTAEQQYSDEEIVRRAKATYETIRSKVDPGNTGKILAIDVVTGEWELDADQIAAGDRLHARLTNPQVFFLRIGFRAVHHFGGRSSRIEE